MEQGAKKGAIAAAGAVAFGGWVAGTVSWKAPVIEEEAIGDVRQRLVDEGIDVSKVELVGNFREVEIRGLDDVDADAVRNAVIGGVVSDVKLSDEAPNLSGASGADSSTTADGSNPEKNVIAPAVAAPVIKGEISSTAPANTDIIFDGERLTIRGTLDSEATRLKVIEAASKVVDGSLITTEIGIDPKATMGAGSVEVLTSVLSSLDYDFRSTRIEFDGKKMDVAGILRTNEVSSSYPSAIAEARRAGVLVSEDLRSPEAAGDVLAFSRLNAETTDNGLVLSGSVIKIAQYNQLMEAAETAFGVGNVVDQVVIAPPRGLPDQTSDPAVASFSELVRALGTGKGKGRFSLDGAKVTVSGSVEDAAAKQVFDSVVASAKGVTIEGTVTANLDAAQADQLEAGLNALAASDPVEFASGSVGILPESDVILGQVADLMKASAGVVVTVEGHTDALGDELFNQVLSVQRADAVRNALIAKGVSAERLASAGFGESRPIADNATTAGRGQNRRVVFVVNRG